MSDGETLPQLVFRNAGLWPARPAWRHKRLGIWQTRSWADFAARVQALARGLAQHGFAHGDRLAVCGDNRPDLYAALLAAQALGGVGVPLDPLDAAKHIAATIADARVSIVVADTTEHAEWLLPLSAPAQVFCADAGGMHHDETWEQRSLDALVEEGRTLDANAVMAAMADAAPQDLALLLYPPKGSHATALSHGQLLAAAKAIDDADPVKLSDETLCYLPMSSYDDAVYSLALGLLGGFVCNCPEARDSVPIDLREIGPTILLAPPAVCIALTDIIAAKASAVSGFKRRSFALFQRIALRAEALRERGQAVPMGLGIGCRIGELLAYAPVRDQLGLSRVRWVRSDAPVPPDTARLLRAFGVALRGETRAAAEPALAHETQHA